MGQVTHRFVWGHVRLAVVVQQWLTGATVNRYIAEASGGAQNLGNSGPLAHLAKDRRHPE